MTSSSEPFSTAPRSKEREVLGAAIEARDAAAQALAAAHMAHAAVADRLAKENRALSEARASGDGDEVSRDLADLDLLVHRDSARRQKADAAEAAVGVLERALKVRAREVGEAEDVLAGAERA
ncbi:hypothetical protein, partial [Roseiarcus sp.]|uniref:hypothetical protein n=1 Tax=Roseiarcus sp. TaxID=1969460 RepID=UPI003F98CFFC